MFFSRFYKRIFNKKTVPLLYYKHVSSNFGDELSPLIVNKLYPGITTIDFTCTQNYPKRLLALGTILHMAKEHDLVWGAGANPIRFNGPNKIENNKLKNIDVRAVRGPMTRDFLLKNGVEHCPEIYGDPALLLPVLFPELKPKPERKYGVIPHFQDLKFFENEPNVFSPHNHWKDVIDFILGCELVISSSLHGIIVAEAFGIPARWLYSEDLPSSRTEGTFKYHDYYLGTKRNPGKTAGTVEEALAMGGSEPIKDFDHKALLGSFPYDEISN